MQTFLTSLKNWITTLIGIISGLAIILPQILALVDGDPATIFSYEQVIAGLGVMGIGIFAKDAITTGIK